MTIGNLRAPGTHITKRLDQASELWTNVKAALIIVVACDAILTVIALTALKAGWWVLPILACVFGFLVGVFSLAMCDRLGIAYPDWFVLLMGNGWAIGAILGGLLGYIGRTHIDPFLAFLTQQIAQAFDIPWWWWAIGAVTVALVSALVRKWWAAIGSTLALIVTALALGIDEVAWSEIGNMAAWMALVYTWPVASAATVLILVMLKEMIWPSLEYTLKAISMEELREVGLLGLYFPRLLGAGPQELIDVDAEVIDVNLTSIPKGRSKPQVTRPRLPGCSEAREFYRAVHRGESFSLRTARKYGLSRHTFNTKIRDGFIDRGLARWINEQHHEQGVELYDAGTTLIEHLALIGTTP